MLNNTWKKSLKTIAGIPCCENTVNMNAGIGKAEYETVLGGKFGEIWQYSEDTFCVLVRKAKIINDQLATGQQKYKQGEEKVFKVKESELPFWLERLKIPKRSVKSQLKYLNA